ncbi:carotenoid isomerase [Leptolyngbya iicbica]|uniref:prolycopene isomerase n=2 Tax=Cyanophyceae TaxID=3028117 RepID=A0A4Q7E2A0_9CYAN|nr:carotenoid isomerase [Leptolyngbya sp. LK]RZM75374.1 carotene isomerase [Leptolyngbya sp. LK]
MLTADSPTTAHRWPTGSHFDVIVIGSGIGGLVTATQLAAKGLRPLVLERYLIPGGSAGYFERDGYRFDVGASMIFGFGQQGTTNLLTRALAAVGQQIETIPDPVQVHYRLPNGLSVRVHRDYEQFLAELGDRFPHEREGIRRFYDTCWQVFNCLNSIELLSLEEPRYVARVFAQNPLACLGLARRLPANVGGLARRYLRDPELLHFIDMECYCWSVVPAAKTPLINAGMVFSDRHYGGVNYPQGGVGRIAEALATGLQEAGGHIQYQSRVTRIVTEAGRAIGVELATGERYTADRIVSNATRWDTFETLLDAPLPRREQRWQQAYTAAPSFLSVHLGVDAAVIPPDTDCHQILLDDWADLEAPNGTLFLSIPTLLDPSLAPPGCQILHTFTPSWMSDWQGRSPSDYAQHKRALAQQLIQRLERVFPGVLEAIDHCSIGTPRTHRRFLGRMDGTYGPMPHHQLRGLLNMPFNRTAIPGLYCVGDSTFPGQGLNAVAFSGFACAHRVAADLTRS